MNPGQESVENIIKVLSNFSKNDYICFSKTKDDPKVGSFGLIPNCSSYMITGYCQEYENIFIRVKTFLGDKWNGKFSDNNIDLPS